MNYRHHFHAGNFADVAKHALLVLLIRALQRKEKGFLFLDTHAGRGGYDLTAAARGDSLVRRPEHPDGIGRLLDRADWPAELAEYIGLVRAFDREVSGIAATRLPPGPALGHYPGSPWLARRLARPQDRLVLCEKHPGECAALREAFLFSPRTQVEEMDGFAALRAMLPPPEKRGLILIDPPYEAPDEWARIVGALDGALRRFPSGVYAVWYPLTERARAENFMVELLALKPPPTLVVELLIAGEQSALKMKGCGLVILNPPWQFERAAAPVAAFLSQVLAQSPGGGGRMRWLVEE